MAGSAVAARTGIPASRQKNCNSCVLAKRRCDRRTPCSRCVEKNVACVYSKSRGVNRPEKCAAEPTPFTDSPLDFADLSFDMDYLDDIPTGFQTNATVESTPDSIQDTTSSSDISMDTFMHLIGNKSSSSSENWLINTEEECLPRRPATPADKVARGYDTMMVCNFDASDVYDPKTPLYYVLNSVRNFTEEMAIRNTTPFIHERLYYGYKPQCIVSCFATCVLYSSRKPTNMAMVMRALSNNVRELVDAEVSRVVSTPIEKLARSQALFLYQVIRLFDGDVSLRAQAEKDMGLFKTWLAELCHIRDNLGDLARLEYTSVKEQPPIEWEKWIFAECLRRTIIMAYAVIGLYELLKDPTYNDPDGFWAYAHRWTLGRSLWHAGSSAAFQRAWRDSSHFIIANFTLGSFIENGKRENVDEFAEILLSVYLGCEYDETIHGPAERKISDDATKSQNALTG